MRNLLLSTAAFGPADGRSASPKSPVVDDPLIPAESAAAIVGLSVAAFWRSVGDGRLPKPVYPSPRAPRWRASELRSALEATRQFPRDAKEARREALLARREQAEAAPAAA